MPPVGIESTILASERPQMYALDRAATVTIETLLLQPLYAFVAWAGTNSL